MKTTRSAMFFPNGNTAFFTNGQQTPELQESWLLLYVAFLESKGIDPENVPMELPNGMSARVFKTENGYNWRIV